MCRIGSLLDLTRIIRNVVAIVKTSHLEGDGEARDGEKTALSEKVGPGDGDREVTDVAIYKLYREISRVYQGVDCPRIGVVYTFSLILIRISL